MKKQLSLFTLVLFTLSACKKKETKYTIIAQSARFSYIGPAPEPYVFNYDLILRSIPFFTYFGKPVSFPDGHYESIVTTPYEINSGAAELVMSDSVGTIIERYILKIPPPQGISEHSFDSLYFVGKNYQMSFYFKYDKVK